MEFEPQSAFVDVLDFSSFFLHSGARIACYASHLLDLLAAAAYLINFE